MQLYTSIRNVSSPSCFHKDYCLLVLSNQNLTYKIFMQVCIITNNFMTMTSLDAFILDLEFIRIILFLKFESFTLLQNYLSEMTN